MSPYTTATGTLAGWHQAQGESQGRGGVGMFIQPFSGAWGGSPSGVRGRALQSEI